MFEIKLLEKPRATPSPLHSKITIGDFSEQFDYYPFDEKITNIENDWHSNLKELVEEKKNVIFLQYDPRFAWAIYKEGETCYVQNVLSLDGDFSKHLNRKTITEDGMEISEWRTNISMIRDFLKNSPSE